MWSNTAWRYRKMKMVKVFKSNVGFSHEFKVEDKEAKALARAIVSGSGIKNIREDINSVTGYSNNGVESIHVSIRDV